MRLKACFSLTTTGNLRDSDVPHATFDQDTAVVLSQPWTDCKSLPTTGEYNGEIRGQRWVRIPEYHKILGYPAILSAIFLIYCSISLLKTSCDVVLLEHVLQIWIHSFDGGKTP